MSASRSLLRRWGRRDRLAVLAVAVATALLVGTTLLLVTVGAETTAIAAGNERSVTVAEYDSVAAARAAAGPNATVLPLADVKVNGSPAVLVGVPHGNRSNATLELPERPDREAIRGPVVEPGPRRVAGAGGERTTTVRPRAGDAGLPPSWYVADDRTTEELGATGALVVVPDGDAEKPAGARQWTRVPSALAYFVAGTEQLLGLLWPVAVGAGVLSGVVVFSVTRMSVRDRRSTVAVLRATGAPPRTVLGAFAVRAGLVAGVGVALGYALGVVIPSLAVSAATFLGLPVTLSPTTTGRVVTLVVPVLVGLVGVGVLAGGLAAWPAVRRPPASLTRGPTLGGARTQPGSTGVAELRSGEGISPGDGHAGDAGTADGGGVRGRLAALGGLLAPQFLDARAVVPTGAALSVFVATVLLVAGIAGALAPLTGTGGSIADADASHPVASSVDADYATALRAQGVDASPEILLFAATDGRPYLARGANYSAFASVTDARLVEGRAPRGPEEAVVGRDLAAARDLSVGETVLIGGRHSVVTVATVRIVGIYEAPGLYDDQLLVSLDAARHLAKVRPARVNVVRVRGGLEAVRADGNGSGGSDDDPAAANGSRIAVTGLSVPSPPTSNGTVDVRVTVRNLGDERVRHRVEVALGDRWTNRTVAVGGNDRSTVPVTFQGLDPGTYALRAGDLRREVTVPSESRLRLAPLPDRAPPGAAVRVSVEDGRARAVTNATARVDATGATARADDSGVATVRLPDEPGEYAIDVSTPDGRSATRAIRVAAGTGRLPTATVTVEPSAPTVLTRPTATVVVHNPWNRTIVRTVAVTRDGRPGPVLERRVRLAPGGRATIRGRLERAAPGSHDLTVTANGTRVATAGYEVRGDERVASAAARSGDYAPSGGLGRATRRVFGNVELLLATLLGLVAMATVGTVTAGFAGTVHARRRTIGVYRATGATGRQVLALVLADAARLSVVAAVPAVAVGYLSVRLLELAGLTTVFGVDIVPADPSLALLGAAIGAVVVALCGAALATVPMVRCPPARLFD